MPSPTEEASLPELLRSIADQAQVFARAEIDLVKVEVKQGLTKGVVMLIVVTVSSLLVALAISMVAAAIVLARQGSAATALLTAAGVDVLIAGTAVGLLLAKFRKKASDATAAAAQLSNSPQHGSHVS